MEEIEVYEKNQLKKESALPYSLDKFGN